MYAAIVQGCGGGHRSAIMSYKLADEPQASDMTKKTVEMERKVADRKARLAEELRLNLQKRKAQTRSRRTGEADTRPEGIAASSKGTKA